MGRSSLVIRPSSPEDRPAIASLLDRMLGSRSFEQRTKLWDWRYTHNPAKCAAIPEFLVADSDGAIVGVHGLTALRFRLNSAEVTAAASCDFVVDPSARTAGMKLKASVFDPSVADIAISTSANQSAAEITLAFKGVELEGAKQKFIYPLRVSGLISRKIARRWPPRILAVSRSSIRAALRPLDLIVGRLRKRKVGKYSGLELSKAPSFDDPFDRLWQELCDDWAGLVVRDSSYLTWRYQLCPFGKNTTIALYSNEVLRGFAVVSFVLDEEGLLRGAITELFTDFRNADFVSMLLEGAVEEAIKQRAEYLTIQLHGVRCENQLSMMGFIRRAGDKYSPWTIRINKSLNQSSGLGCSDWLFSPGDGDCCIY